MRNFTLQALLILTFLAPFGLSAQVIPASQVSITARNNFATSVPGVTPEWKSGSKGNFEAWFAQEGTQKVYIFDSQGNLRIKKANAKAGELPPAITASLFKQYGKGDFQNAFKVITAEKKKYYEIVVARPTGNDLWQFTPEGSLLGKRISSGSEATGTIASSDTKPAGGTPPRADGSPVPNAPDYDDESKDIGTSIEEDLEILDEDPLEDLDILEEDAEDLELLDEDLLDEDLDESFDEDLDDDMN
jgi:hypothetical protein